MSRPWSGAGYAAMLVIGALLLLSAVPIAAQPYDVPPTWGGDIWSRPRLTADWFGLRDDLGKKGVVFDVDLLLTTQSVMTGGVDTGSEFWGNAGWRVHVDGGELGLRQRQARPRDRRLPEAVVCQRLWPQRVQGLRRDRAGQHAGDRSCSRPRDHSAHERDVHAVPQYQVRADDRQVLHARRLPGRVR